MWAARHLSERQQRKFVGAGGTSSRRPRKDEALKERAKQREREERGGERLCSPGPSEDRGPRSRGP